MYLDHIKVLTGDILFIKKELHNTSVTWTKKNYTILQKCLIASLLFQKLILHPLLAKSHDAMMWLFKWNRATVALHWSINFVFF